MLINNNGSVIKERDPSSSIINIDNELDKVRKRVVNRLFNKTDLVNNAELFVKYFVYIKLYKNYYKIKELTVTLNAVVQHLTQRRQKDKYILRTGISLPTDKFNMFKKRFLVAANLSDSLIRELLLVPKYTYLIKDIKQQSSELLQLLEIERVDLTTLDNAFLSEIAKQLELYKRVPLGNLLGSLTVRTVILKPRTATSYAETHKIHKETLAAFKQTMPDITLKDLIDEYGLEPSLVYYPAVTWNFVCWNKPQTLLSKKYLRYCAFKQSKSESSIYRQLNQHLFNR